MDDIRQLIYTRTYVQMETGMREHFYTYATYANIFTRINRHGWRRGCTNIFTHIQHICTYANIFTRMRTCLHI